MPAVSEEQERFQEEWEPVEADEGEFSPHVTGEDEVFTAGGEDGSALQPTEQGRDSSTFPPLPPPNFDDLSPTDAASHAS